MRTLGCGDRRVKGEEATGPGYMGGWLLGAMVGSWGLGWRGEVVSES